MAVQAAIAPEGRLAIYSATLATALRFLLFSGKLPTSLTLCWHRDPPLKCLKQPDWTWCCVQQGWLLSLWEFQSCISVLKNSFLPRKRLRPSCPPVFFLPGNSGAEDLSSRWLASSRRLSARVPRCHRESTHLSSSPNSISVPPRLRVMWCALKKKDTSICLLWMSPWLHISARPRLLDGRRGRHIHPSHAELHLC